MSTGVASGSNLNFGDTNTNTNTESEPKSNKNRQLALLLGTLSDTFKGESDKTLQRIEFLDDREKKQEQNKLFDRTRARVAQSVKDGTLPATMLDLLDALGAGGTATFLAEESKFMNKGPDSVSDLEFDVVKEYLAYEKEQIANNQTVLPPEQYFEEVAKSEGKLEIYNNAFRKYDFLGNILGRGFKPDEVEDI